VPSAVDQRRLRDGARALAGSDTPGQTADELRRQIDSVAAGIAAMQSLDDLGPEGNARALEDQKALWDRLRELEQLLKELE
jgi:hypothetical protein